MRIVEAMMSTEGSMSDRPGRHRESLELPEAEGSLWPEQWARGKRIFIAMAWHNIEARTRLFLGITFIVIGVIIGIVEKF